MVQSTVWVSTCSWPYELVYLTAHKNGVNLSNYGAPSDIQQNKFRHNVILTPGAEGVVGELEWKATTDLAKRLRIVDSQVKRLEDEIDLLNKDLAPLTSFVLPGGTPAAAYLHLARTVCRRAERLMTELAGKRGEKVSPAALKYINRLSDFLFVAARYANDMGARDVLWVPGQNR